LFITLLSTAVAGEPLLQQATKDPLALKSLFAKFSTDNDRVYSSPLEAKLRLNMFRRFVKDAVKINDEQDEVKVGITFFADMTEEEKAMYHGANMTNIEGEVDGEIIAEPEEALQWGPTSTVSWKRNYGAVKSQRSCASCWAFGAAGVTEGFQSIKTGRYTALSEQHVLDCSGAGDCYKGGYHLRALNWIKSRNHLASSSSYRYTGSKGRCRNTGSALSIRVNSIYQARGDSNLAKAISRGPVAVLLYNFHGVSVEGYQSGVLSAKNLDSSMPGAMNHIVVAVGYNSRSWELRNSWGSGWGEGGYFMWKRSSYNNRGISDYAYTMTVSSTGEEVEE